MCQGMDFYGLSWIFKVAGDGGFACLQPSRRGGWITVNVKILLYIGWAFSVQCRHENYSSSYTRLDLNSLRGAGILRQAARPPVHRRQLYLAPLSTPNVFHAYGWRGTDERVRYLSQGLRSLPD